MVDQDKLFDDSWPDEGISGFSITSSEKNVTSSENKYQTWGSMQGLTVTVEMQRRGEYAELFVIEEIWQRFLRLEKIEKTAWERLWKRFIDFREKFPGGKKMTKELRDCEHQLLEAPYNYKALFRRAIDLSGYGIAGFDVIDPFGGLTYDGQEGRAPILVEVKSIVGSANPRIVMTSHEYRIARQNQDRFVLRVVLVPSEEQRRDPNAYRMIDFTNVCEALNLDKCVLDTIRRGNFDVVLPESSGG